MTLKAEKLHSPKELGDALPARLRRRRRELGLLARQAARRIGVNLFTYSNWEKAQNEPLDRCYPAIIDFLGYEPWPEPTTIGEKLQAERRRRGLTVKRVATLHGVDEGTWRKWESNARNVHYHRCRKVVAAFLKGAADQSPDSLGS